MAGWTLHTPSQHNQPCLLSKLFPVFIEKYFLFVRGSISCLYTGYFLVITRRIFFFRNKCLAGWTLHLNKSFPINTENNQRSISPFVKSQEREVVLALKCHLKSTKGRWRSFWWNWNRFKIKIPFFIEKRPVTQIQVGKMKAIWTFCDAVWDLICCPPVAINVLPL